jgi:hypothetical protein
MRRKAAQMRFNGIRAQAIVCVQENDVFPATGTETRVPRSSQTSIFLSHTSSTGITPHHLRNIIR